MMRVAHLGLIGAVLLTACGGRLGSEPSEEITQVSGFHSYDVTITGVKATTMGGGPPPPVTTAPSEGRSFRVDLERSETVRAVFAAPHGDAVLAESGVTGTVTLSADRLVSFSGGSSPYGGTATETWKSMTVSFDAAGRPVEGTITGQQEVYSGDVGWMSELTAKVTFAPDKQAPSFRASSSVGFASVPLPWDDRMIEASEPYANTLDLSSLLGKDAGKWKPTPLTQKTWVGDTTRGYLLRLMDWDAPMPLPVATPPARDLEGNVASAGSMRLEGRSVARRAVPYLRFDDYAGAATSWGAAKPSTSCRSGTGCIEIGPFRASYCNTGSKGGIATRLPGGTGIVSATVRMTGKRIASYGGGSVPPGMIKLAVARPGEVPVVALDSDLHPTITDEGLDTGWVKISAKAPGGSETGVALGVGGTGTASGCYGYPMPEEWELTVYVDSIDLTPAETK